MISLDHAEVIFETRDLLPDNLFLLKGVFPVTEYSLVAVARKGDRWLVAAADDHGNTRSLDGYVANWPRELSVTWVREVVRRAAHLKPDTWTPTLSAETLARQIKARIRLSPEELRADPAFAALAWDAAHAGRAYSQDMLAWEKKPVVAEAVNWFRERVEAERKAQAKAERLAERKKQRQLGREAPVRDAVTDAYETCRYRKCVQGHSMVVVIRECPGVAATTFRSSERYSSRCTFKKMTSSHTVYVRADYLKRTAKTGNTWNDRLILDAESVGFSKTFQEVFDILVVRQAKGTDLEEEAVRVVVAADGLAKYTGKIYQRGEVAAAIGFSADVPEFAFHDKLMDLGYRH